MEDPYYIKPAFQINGLDNLHITLCLKMLKSLRGKSLEKCFLIIENQLCGYLNSDLLSSKNTCVVSFEDYYLNPEKYIKKFETLLDK